MVPFWELEHEEASLFNHIPFCVFVLIKSSQISILLLALEFVCK